MKRFVVTLVMSSLNHGNEPSRYSLYLMHMIFSFASRMWEIGTTFFVGNYTQNSLQIAALVGLMSSVIVFAFSSSIGAWFDSNNRLYAVKVVLSIKMLSVAVTYLLCSDIFALSSLKMIQGLFVYLIPILCAVANVSFSMLTMIIEKDWIVTMADGNSEWLATTNAHMTQIDMVCATVAPAIVGFLFSFFNDAYISLSLLGMNIVAWWLLFGYLKQLYFTWPALATKTLSTDDSHVIEGGGSCPCEGERSSRSEVSQRCSATADAVTSSTVLPKKKTNGVSTATNLVDQADVIRRFSPPPASASKKTTQAPKSDNCNTPKLSPSKEAAGRELKPLQLSVDNADLSDTSSSSGEGVPIVAPTTMVEVGESPAALLECVCAGAMISYACIYLTVLSFGSLMIVYLRWAGLPDHVIGLARGVSSISGFTGAWVFPMVVQSVGVHRAGMYSIWMQATMVMIAAVSIFVLPKAQGVWVMTISVVGLYA